MQFSHPQPAAPPPPNKAPPNNPPSTDYHVPETDHLPNISPNYVPHSLPIPSLNPLIDDTPDLAPPGDSSNEFLTDGGPSMPGAYLRTETPDGFTYTHPTAGQSFGHGKTKWELLEQVMRTRYPRKPWGMWKDWNEWQITRWMATKKVSQGDLNELLKADMVSLLKG